MTEPFTTIVDHISVAAPPANPKLAGQELVFVAASGTGGVFQRNEKALATWSVNAWTFTPAAKLVGRTFIDRLTRKRYWHDGQDLVEVPSATSVDTAKADAISDGAAAALATIRALVSSGAACIVTTDGSDFAAIEPPDADDVKRVLAATRSSSSGQIVWSWEPA